MKRTIGIVLVLLLLLLVLLIFLPSTLLPAKIQLPRECAMDGERIRSRFPGCGPITATTREVYIRKILQGGYKNNI